MSKRHRWIRPKQDRWGKHFEFWHDIDTNILLCSGTTNVCPHCGGRAYIPPATISSDDDISIRNRYENTCHLIRVCDESNSCIGYQVHCKLGENSYKWFNIQRNLCYAKLNLY